MSRILIPLCNTFDIAPNDALSLRIMWCKGNMVFEQMLSIFLVTGVGVAVLLYTAKSRQVGASHSFISGGVSSIETISIPTQAATITQTEAMPMPEVTTAQSPIVESPVEATAVAPAIAVPVEEFHVVPSESVPTIPTATADVPTTTSISSPISTIVGPSEALAATAATVVSIDAPALPSPVTETTVTTTEPPATPAVRTKARRRSTASPRTQAKPRASRTKKALDALPIEEKKE
jgi:hypothetical protein